MSFDFASVRSLTIPEGAVTMITAADGTVLWKLGYTWKKYNTVTNTTYSENWVTATNGADTIYSTEDTREGSTSYTFDASTGKFALVSPKQMTVRVGNYYISESFRYKGRLFECTKILSTTSSHRISGLLATANANTTYSRGTYISDVTSTDENAYPADGVHTDGYWYVKQS